MAEYSVARAKDRLSALIAKAQAGEEVIITSHGKPVVELNRITPKANTSQNMTQWLIERTRARKSLGITSVQLLDLMYDEDEA